jgi:hypothetical protein
LYNQQILKNVKATLEHRDGGGTDEKDAMRKDMSRVAQGTHKYSGIRSVEG